MLLAQSHLGRAAHRLQLKLGLRATRILATKRNFQLKKGLNET